MPAAGRAQSRVRAMGASTRNASARNAFACNRAAGFPGLMGRSRVFQSAGFTLIEVLLAVAIAMVMAGVALPVTAGALDELRALAAARYLAGRIVQSRMEAITRSTSVALRFEPAGPDYVFTPYADGNGNGVRAADIHRGIDPPAGVPHQLGDSFGGVRLGLLPGLPDVDGAAGGSTDGVRIGTARILTMSANGTATSGTLYVQGRRAQYAVRVLGATGRTRVLKFDTGAGTWISR